MNNDRDIHWMQHALALSQHAFDIGEVPVGAVVVCDDILVGEGWNQPISEHDPCGHAEIVALRQAAQKIQNYRLPKTTLYVTIEPCTMCLGAIFHSRVERVVFGALEPKAGVLESHKHVVDSDIYNHNFEWLGGVCASQCSEIIQRFFRQRRAQKKAQKSLSDSNNT